MGVNRARSCRGQREVVRPWASPPFSNPSEHARCSRLMAPNVQPPHLQPVSAAAVSAAAVQESSRHSFPVVCVSRWPIWSRSCATRLANLQRLCSKRAWAAWLSSPGLSKLLTWQHPWPALGSRGSLGVDWARFRPLHPPQSCSLMAEGILVLGAHSGPLMFGHVPSRVPSSSVLVKLVKPSRGP